MSRTDKKFLAVTVPAIVLGLAALCSLSACGDALDYRAPQDVTPAAQVEPSNDSDARNTTARATAATGTFVARAGDCNLFRVQDGDTAVYVTSGATNSYDDGCAVAVKP